MSNLIPTPNRSGTLSTATIATPFVESYYFHSVLPMLTTVLTPVMGILKRSVSMHRRAGFSPAVEGAHLSYS